MYQSLICISLLGLVFNGCFAIPIAFGQVDSSEDFPTAEQVHIEKYRDAALKNWSDAIAALEAKDKTETHPDDSILFLGSSSIRLWEDIAADMAPYPSIRRGYGGARWTDLVFFAERLIQPHQCRAIVFFVGNDISGGNDDRTPQEVADLCAYVLGIVREHDATVPVFFIAVTPTASRFSAWPNIKAANARVGEMCARRKNTYFIGTESLFLDAAGQPRPELFRNDRLHLSRRGYILWAAAIKSHLDTVLGGAE